MKNRKEMLEEIGELLERADHGALAFTAAFLREADARGGRETGEPSSVACGDSFPQGKPGRCGGKEDADGCGPAGPATTKGE